MATSLPVELVGEIWRAAAELFIETDHRTVLDIAASCTIGYHSATPVIYRTLLMKDGVTELIMRVFSTEISSVPTLSTPPALRLCPLVKRLCSFKVPNEFNTEDLKHLTGLETICDSLETFLLGPLSPTLRHFSTWTASWPQRLPSTLTHVSLYCYFITGGQAHYNQLKAYTLDTLPETVTHFALTFCYPFPQGTAVELSLLIPFVLAQNGMEIFTIWLFGDAAQELNYLQLLRAIAALQLCDRHRVRLWRDMRSDFHPYSSDFVALVNTDVVAGRTLWTESRPIVQEDLTAAMILNA